VLGRQVELAALDRANGIVHIWGGKIKFRGRKRLTRMGDELTEVQRTHKVRMLILLIFEINFGGNV